MIGHSPFVTPFPRLNYHTRQLGFDDLFEEVESAFANDPFFDMNRLVHEVLPRTGVPAVASSEASGQIATTPGDDKAVPSGEAGIMDVDKNKQLQAAAAAPAAAQSPQQMSLWSPETSSWFSAYARGPALDVSERDQEFVVSVDVPGVDKKDIKLRLTQDPRGRHILTVSGERKEEKSEEDKERGYRSSHRLFGHFSRSVRLPDNIRQDGVTAKHDNGVLKICIPKTVRLEHKANDIQIE